MSHALCSAHHSNAIKNIKNEIKAIKPSLDRTMKFIFISTLVTSFELKCWPFNPKCPDKLTNNIKKKQANVFGNNST